MKNINVVNQSSKDISSELYETIWAGDIDEINRVCEEYCLKILEWKKEPDLDIIIIADRTCPKNYDGNMLFG